MGKIAPIAFNRAYLNGNELHFIKQAFANTRSGPPDGFTKVCEAFIVEELKAPKCLLTHSTSQAIDIAGVLLNISPGDEVIVPSFCSVSIVNPFLRQGAKLIFADVRTDTLNIDENYIESILTEKTRAIVASHYAGIGCEMDAIQRVAAKHGLGIVEDNSNGLFAKYKGRFLGTFGSLSALSFHQLSGFHCGDGGALIVNDATLIARAETLRDAGTNLAQFRRGEADQLQWMDSGIGSAPSEILAAFLFAQFQAKQSILSMRKRVWESLHSKLKDWAQSVDVRLAQVPTHCEQNYPLFFLLASNPVQRQQLLEHLKSRGVLATRHYAPLHLSEMGQKHAAQPANCPNSEKVGETLIRLPFHTDMTESELSQIVSALKSFDNRTSVALNTPFAA